MEIKNNKLIKVTDKDIINGTVNIPNNITKIESHAFERCQSLKKIIIPDSVTEIGSGAFAGCNSLDKFKVN